jgi:hypothetical protein
VRPLSSAFMTPWFGGFRTPGTASDMIDAACQLRLRGDIPATSFVQTKVLLGSISEIEKFEEIRGNLPSCTDTNYP